MKSSGFPYEEQEKMRREENKGRKEAFLHNQCETASAKTEQKTGRETRRLKEETNSEDPCAGINELYEQIRNMDCQLNKIQFKCPIHDVVLPN